MGTLRQAGILVPIWHPLPVQGNLAALNQVCSRKIATTRWLHQLMVYFCGYREPTKEEKWKIFTVFFFINFEIYCTMMLYWKDGSLSLFKMYTRALTLSFSSSGRLSIFSLKEGWLGSLAAGIATFGSTGCSLINWQGWPKKHFDTFQLGIQCCFWFSINPLENLRLWYLYLCFLYLNPSVIFSLDFSSVKIRQPGMRP